jgi:class 3 adenylate cyclase
MSRTVLATNSFSTMRGSTTLGGVASCSDGDVKELPPIRYVNIGEESIAYRDLGGDGIPIVYLGTFGSHQDLMWEEPGYAHFLRSLGSFGRLVAFDRRGSGLSSRTVRPTIEVRAADLDAVLDAAGIDQAVLVAATGSTMTALAFAAMRPARTRALVLYSATARQTAAPGYEIGADEELIPLILDSTEATWGTGITGQLYAPSLAGDPQFIEWCARLERSIATPLEARQWIEMYGESDVRDVLPLVDAPSLVVTPVLAAGLVPALSSYVADHLPGVRAVEIASRDQYPFGDGADAFLEATRQFLVDVGELEHLASNRRLATVLFTDLVGSTEQVRLKGDRAWTTTMDTHDDLVRRIAARNAGRVIKSTGDGVLAVFEGPASSVRAAAEILRSVHRIGLIARAGVHVGEVEERGDDVAGIAVTLASRIADCAHADEVLTSGVVRDLVAGSGIRFESRGSHQLKGIDEPVEVLGANVD